MSGPTILSDVVASNKLARRVRALIAERGVKKTSEILKVGREVCTRLAGGAPVRRGSLLIAEHNLASAGLYGDEP